MEFNFDNRYAALGGKFYASLLPRPLPNPEMVFFNEHAASLIDFPSASISSDNVLNLCSGSYLPEGSDPLAMVYSGHQFGGYSPRLGDGRGLLLGQIRNRKDELWDLHLKGAGLTPFSRMGDGRAVLRSCIREFLASEALHHLGIPTTRALSITTSEEPVRRETIEKASMLIRLGETHIRFGTFEFFFYTNQHDELRQLCDYTIDHHFQDLKGMEHPYDKLLEKIAEKTGSLIAHWQAFGFAHGVMNTDNMSVLGQTFDYGPYGFMEKYNPSYICNHSDDGGRYAFNQQPKIGFWNCHALTKAFAPLIKDETEEIILQKYQESFYQNYDNLMLAKLGLTSGHEGDRELCEDLLELLEAHKIDYTNFFRGLSHFKMKENEHSLPILKTCTDAFKSWFLRYKSRLEHEKSQDKIRQKQMCSINPKYILRNYLAQIAIQKSEMGDHSELKQLYTILTQPYDEQPGYEKYAHEPPEWGKNLQISCSS
jgi:serine/tyrosine/threonine adenylyltransferase